MLVDSLPIPESTCYLYVIQLQLTCPVPQEQNIRGRKIRHPEDAGRYLGILSRNEIPTIPEFNIYDRSGEIKVSLVLAADDVFVGQKELDMSQHFHYVMFSHVLALERYSLQYNPSHAPSKLLIVPVSKSKVLLGIEILSSLPSSGRLDRSLPSSSNFQGGILLLLKKVFGVRVF